MNFMIRVGVFLISFMLSGAAIAGIRCDSTSGKWEVDQYGQACYTYEIKGSYCYGSNWGIRFKNSCTGTMYFVVKGSPFGFKNGLVGSGKSRTVCFKNSDRFSTPRCKRQ